MAEILADGINAKTGKGISKNHGNVFTVDFIFTNNQSADIFYLVIINNIILRIAIAEPLRTRFGMDFYP